jgi:hypothetical protein
MKPDFIPLYVLPHVIDLTPLSRSVFIYINSQSNFHDRSAHLLSCKGPTSTTTLATNGAAFTSEETPSCGGRHAPAARHRRDDTYSCRYVRRRSAAVRCVDTCRDGLRCRRRYLLAPKRDLSWVVQHLQRIRLQFNVYKRRLGQHRWRLQRLPP